MASALSDLSGPLQAGWNLDPKNSPEPVQESASKSSAVIPDKVDFFALQARYKIYAHLKHCTVPPKNTTKEGSNRAKDLPTLSDTLPDLTKDSITKDKPVCIIGAGMAGLYTAMILESLGIPFEIIEARDRVGGRMFTHRFGTATDYEYYDVGAMRFPKTDFMDRTFGLVEGRLTGRVRFIDYIFESKGSQGVTNTFNHYNGVQYPRPGANPNDPYNINAVQDPSQNDPTLRSRTRVFSDLKDYPGDLQRAMTETIEKYDKYSMRSSLTHIGELPSQVINVLETFDKSTAWYDRALVETICEDLAFNWTSSADQLEWKCIDGGSSRLPEAMEAFLRDKIPKFNDHIRMRTKVTAIVDPALPKDANVPSTDRHRSGLTVHFTDGKTRESKTYGAAVCTLPLSIISFLDLSKSGIHKNYAQWSGLRQLQYGAAVKIGIRFKTNWWYEEFGILGGQSHTDLPIRTVVYPSYPPGDNKSNVLIVSYCWTQDAERLGAFIDNETGKLKGAGEEIVLRNLREVHGLDANYDFGQIETFAYNWLQDPLNMGGFAFFGPQHFSDPTWVEMSKPACQGQLFFAGEASSACHAWVAGALDSAWVAVMSLLKVYDFPQTTINKFLEEWGHSEYFDPANDYIQLDIFIRLALWQAGFTHEYNP